MVNIIPHARCHETDAAERSAFQKRRAICPWLPSRPARHALVPSATMLAPFVPNAGEGNPVETDALDTLLDTGIFGRAFRQCLQSRGSQ